MTLPDLLSKLIQSQDLSAAEAEAAMNIIMSGNATAAQIGAYLIALRIKGEAVAEIIGSARAMRQHATPVHLPSAPRPLIDTAGTGGDNSHSFNISTAAAFVIAGAGYAVAKHGNRSASSQCGSADVLEASGISLKLTATQVATCIEQVGIGFMFAPAFHPAMRHAIGPRRELKQRTIFNLLGPLTNPAGATHQLIGVFNAAWTEPIANVLASLGSQGALVVHGYGNMDELVNTGPNHISQLHADGRLTNAQIDATDLGLKRGHPADYAGGLPSENATLLRAVLSGQANTSLTETVLLNAAAAIASTECDLHLALAQARGALDGGQALAKMLALAELSQQLAAQNPA